MLLGKNMKLQNILAAALVSIGAGLLFFTMPLHASEVANNDYKQRVVQGCQQYMNSNNPDLPAACLYGGLGDAGLQYFPHSAPSCQDRSDYKGEEKTACQRGAESGKNAFRDVFRNLSSVTASAPTAKPAKPAAKLPVVVTTTTPSPTPLMFVPNYSPKTALCLRPVIKA